MAAPRMGQINVVLAHKEWSVIRGTLVVNRIVLMRTRSHVQLITADIIVVLLRGEVLVPLEMCVIWASVLFLVVVLHVFRIATRVIIQILLILIVVRPVMQIVPVHVI